jgi:phospholipase D1/2
MIVDDNLVICGSANINDRSMLGKRDSEVAVIYQDEEYIQSLMDGKEYKAGKFAHSLRTKLFREHLGLLENLEVDLRDPISEDFYRNVWLRTAITNTDIYDTVFHCVPTDKCQTFAQLRDYQQSTPLCHLNPDAARKSLEEVQVKFPALL